MPRCHAPVLPKPKPRLRSLFLRRFNQFLLFLAMLSRSCDRRGGVPGRLHRAGGPRTLLFFNSTISNTSVVPVPDGTETQCTTRVSPCIPVCLMFLPQCTGECTKRCPLAKTHRENMSMRIRIKSESGDSRFRVSFFLFCRQCFLNQTTPDYYY